MYNINMLKEAEEINCLRELISDAMDPVTSSSDFVRSCGLAWDLELISREAVYDLSEIFIHNHPDDEINLEDI